MDIVRLHQKLKRQIFQRSLVGAVLYISFSIIILTKALDNNNNLLYNLYKYNESLAG